MLNNVLHSLKNLKNSDIVENLVKKSQETMSREGLTNLAKKAVDNARAFTDDEINALRGKLKIDSLGRKTTEEAEKALGNVVDKILAGQDSVTEEVRSEIMSMVFELNSGEKVKSGLKSVNNFFMENSPRSLQDLKAMRTNLAKHLISEAQTRLGQKQ
jgi:hypothetical protein